MTREELKEHCEREIGICEFWAIGKGEKPSGKIYEEHKLILELLEQESITKNDLGVDCISRADAKKAIIEYQYSDRFCEEHIIDHSINTSMALIALSDLPSVTPQELRKGHWIKEKIDAMSQSFGFAKYHCSKCNHVISGIAIKETNFCPNCGADMRGNTIRKGKPIEGNNESYNCENWIP